MNMITFQPLQFASSEAKQLYKKIEDPQGPHYIVISDKNGWVEVARVNNESKQPLEGTEIKYNTGTFESGFEAIA
jgi:hypothetical protein